MVDEFEELSTDLFILGCSTIQIEYKDNLLVIKRIPPKDIEED